MQKPRFMIQTMIRNVCNTYTLRQSFVTSHLIKACEHTYKDRRRSNGLKAVSRSLWPKDIWLLLKFNRSKENKSSKADFDIFLISFLSKFLQTAKRYFINKFIYTFISRNARFDKQTIDKGND